MGQPWLARQGGKARVAGTWIFSGQRRIRGAGTEQPQKGKDKIQGDAGSPVHHRLSALYRLPRIHRQPDGKHRLRREDTQWRCFRRDGSRRGAGTHQQPFPQQWLLLLSALLRLLPRRHHKRARKGAVEIPISQQHSGDGNTEMAYREDRHRHAQELQRRVGRQLDPPRLHHPFQWQEASGEVCIY